MKQSKPIHLIKLYGYRCKATCSYCNVMPIEGTVISYKIPGGAKGTFDPEGVTCKRCLKSGDYKTEMDRLKYPLFFLKESK